MLRRHRIEFVYLLGSLLLLPASLHAPTAYAAPGDPPSGSPAGAVYQLPLEQGRSDAAPRSSGGTGPGGGSGGEAGRAVSGGGAANGSGGEAGSLYRSENNFGSSSHVPGVAGAGGGGAGSDGSAGGAVSGVAGAAIAGSAVAAETADTGNTSVPAGIVLIVGIAILAAAVGILSRRFGASRPS